MVKPMTKTSWLFKNLNSLALQFIRKILAIIINNNLNLYSSISASYHCFSNFRAGKVIHSHSNLFLSLFYHRVDSLEVLHVIFLKFWPMQDLKSIFAFQDIEFLFKSLAVIEKDLSILIIKFQYMALNFLFTLS